MTKQHCIILVILSLMVIPSVAASGGSPGPVDGSKWTLEQLAFLSIVIGLVFLTILSYIIKLKDRKLILIMAISATILLFLDYLFFKLVYYA